MNSADAVLQRRINYRELAFASYPPVCAHCGFGIPAVLEVAHIDGNRQNNNVGNLVILCPNCHKSVHVYYKQWLNSQRIEDFRNEQEARRIYQQARGQFAP